jgi:hypothetical protein
MKTFQLSRRRMLGGMLAGPVVSLVGCGPNDTLHAPTSSPNPPIKSGSLLIANVALNPLGAAIPSAGPTVSAGQVKPPLVYFEYSANADEPAATADNLPTQTYNVSTTADRFAEGALCYVFNGANSSITVDTAAVFPQEDFAILLWARTSSQAPMELLRIVDSDHHALVLNVNGPAGVLSIDWTGNPPASIVPVGGAATLADGAWHHITVQKYEGQVQVFIDGIIRGLFFEAGGQLPAAPQTQIGNSWNGAIDTVRIYNRAFPLASIPQTVYTWSQAKPGTIGATGNLQAYFPFYGNAADYLGSGLTGTLNNVVLTSDRHGSSDAAYLFNGSSSSITFAPQFDSVTADFALAFWERSSATGRMTAFSASSGGVAGTTLDIVFNGDAAIEIDLDGLPVPALTVGQSGALTDGNWHFVLLQRVGTVLQLYIDGTLAAATASSAIFFGSTSVLQLGYGSGASPAVENYWNGALDDLQFYEISLTPELIQAVQGLAFLGRDGVGGLSFQGKMWLLGGWNPDLVPVTNSEVWSSPDGVNWTLETIAPWERRHDAGYAVLNGRMWIVGGDRNTGHYQNDVWSSLDGVNWEQVTDSVPWANRATQYVLTFNDRLWLLGGQQIFETAPPYVAYNDVWSSVDGVNWQLETPAALWSPRGLIMGSAVFQGRMWLIGGGTYDSRTFNNDVWSSPDGVHWTLVLANAPWSPRQFHSIAVYDNKLWVLAGGDAESQGGLNDVWYSTDGAKWTQLQGNSWIARHAATTIPFNDSLWFACGSDSSVYNGVWRLRYAQ